MVTFAEEFFNGKLHFCAVMFASMHHANDTHQIRSFKLFKIGNMFRVSIINLEQFYDFAHRLLARLECLRHLVILIYCIDLVILIFIFSGHQNCLFQAFIILFEVLLSAKKSSVCRFSDEFREMQVN